MSSLIIMGGGAGGARGVQDNQEISTGKIPYTDLNDENAEKKKEPQGTLSALLPYTEECKPAEDSESPKASSQR